MACFCLCCTRTAFKMKSRVLNYISDVKFQSQFNMEAVIEIDCYVHVQRPVANHSQRRTIFYLFIYFIYLYCKRIEFFLMRR